MSYEVLLATRGNPAALITCESMDDVIEQVETYQAAQAALGKATEHGEWAGGDVWKDGKHLGRIAWSDDAGYHTLPGVKGPLFDLYGHYEVLLAARGNPDIGQDPDALPYGAPPDRLVSVHLLSQAKQVVRQFIEGEGLGFSQWAGGDVWKNGEHQGVIAYNGRLQPGEKGWLVRDGDYVYGRATQRRAGAATDTFENVLRSFSTDDWKQVLAVLPEMEKTLRAALAPSRVVVTMEDGQVQGVAGDGTLQALIVDFDSEEPDPAFQVPQEAGGTARAGMWVASGMSDKARVDALFALYEEGLRDACEASSTPTP